MCPPKRRCLEENKAEQTQVLVVRAADVLPGGGTADVSYVFFPTAQASFAGMQKRASSSHPCFYKRICCSFRWTCHC
jgi:hypothetical protein